MSIEMCDANCCRRSRPGASSDPEQAALDAELADIDKEIDELREQLQQDFPGIDLSEFDAIDQQKEQQQRMHMRPRPPPRPQAGGMYRKPKRGATATSATKKETKKEQ